MTDELKVQILTASLSMALMLLRQMNQHPNSANEAVEKFIESADNVMRLIECDQ